MLFRMYQPSDCQEMAELFYNTVHTVNARDYTRTQLDAWATGQVDLNQWDQSFRAHFTVVAVKDGIITGFGDIDRNGYLDRLYVHFAYQRQGIASAVCDRLEAAVQENIVTHASVTARPFLKKEAIRL